MVAGQDDLEHVLVQGVGMEALHGGQAQEAAVHGALQDPLLHLLVEVAGDHVKLDVGVDLAEALEDGGQPLGGDTGERGHLHKAGVHAPQAGGGLHQGAVGRAELLDLRQQGPPVRRQHYAAAVAAQQCDSKLLLQRLHRVTDAGLGEVHGLRRLGKVAASRGLEKHLVLGYAHVAPPFLPPFYHTFTHSCKYNNAFYK